MSYIVSNINQLRQQLPAHVKLVAVSKTMPVDNIMEVYNSGQRCFGENRVKELLEKEKQLPGDIEWHLIGHLQTNKVKHIVPFIQMIHSVDSFKLLDTINREAAKLHKTINCLLQIHIAREDTKFGFSFEEIVNMIESESFKAHDNVNICGLMGMATYTTDITQIRQEFKSLSVFFSVLKNKYFSESSAFAELSMGMSDDYKIAIEEGSTLVRIGSLIFGARRLI